MIIEVTPDLSRRLHTGIEAEAGIVLIWVISIRQACLLDALCGFHLGPLALRRSRHICRLLYIVCKLFRHLVKCLGHLPDLIPALDREPCKFSPFLPVSYEVSHMLRQFYDRTDHTAPA